MALLSKKEKQAGGTKKSSTLVWFILLFVLVVIISLPTVMLVLFGMLPTIVAFIIDNTKNKSATTCVAGLNFSGIFPYLMELWMGSHSIDEVTSMMTDVFVLVVIYGSAAFGWMIFMSVPPVVLAILNVIAQRRITTLRNTQIKIIEEWGKDVAQNEADEAPAPPTKTGATATAKSPGMKGETLEMMEDIS